MTTVELAKKYIKEEQEDKDLLPIECFINRSEAKKLAQAVVEAEDALRRHQTAISASLLMRAYIISSRWLEEHASEK